MTQASTKIKLLIFVPTLTCGGVERNVSIICNNINTDKYDVTLAVLNNENPFFKITNKKVKVADLKIIRVRNSLYKMLKLSKEIKPDIILSTANHLNLFFGIFKFFFSKGIKIIARESSIVSINNQRSPYPNLYNWLSKRFYNNIDLVVCQSQYMQKDLVECYNIKMSNTRIIHNAVVPQGLKEEAAKKDEIKNFIAVARLSDEKGLHRLIRAVSLLKIPYRFTIIGEGEMRISLQQLINDLSLEQNVFLAGSKEQPFAVVEHPDLFLMGSYFEGFPNAVLEAIAAGIPVVAFNAPGGIKDLLINYENGILVEGNSEQEFAEAIQNGLDFNFDKKKIQETALNRFNINTIMGQWYKLFDSLK